MMNDGGPPPAGPNRAGAPNAGTQATNSDDGRVYQEQRPRRRQAREVQERHNQRRRELRQRIEQQRQHKQAYMAELRQLIEARKT